MRPVAALPRLPLRAAALLTLAALSLATGPGQAQSSSTVNSMLGLPTVNGSSTGYGAQSGTGYGNNGTGNGTGTGYGNGTGNASGYGNGNGTGTGNSPGYGNGTGLSGRSGGNAPWSQALPQQQPYLTNNPGAQQAGPQGNGFPMGQMPVPYVPGEFELYVQNMVFPMPVRRLGAELMQADPIGAENSPLVPADYVLVPGDELAVSLWGSIDADLRTVVDRSGRISLPRIGSVMVAGQRYGDLPGLLERQVGRLYRGFNLSVSLGQLRGIRVYVTGFVGRPGSYTLSGLSTLSSALIRAGGPTAAGSFRQIELRRGGKVLSQFDLYELLVSGQRKSDLVLQPDDVIHVGPVGPQVAVLGSVNQPAIVELRPGDTLDSALRMVGGLSSVADSHRLTVEPLGDRSGSRVSEVALPAGGALVLGRGDVVTVHSAIDPRQPTVRQNKRVVVEGEVLKPGAYVLPANSSIADALAIAGGMTPNAYVFGTQFTRETVRQTQMINYERVLRDLEVDITRASSTQRISNSDEVKAQEARSDAAARLVEKMRNVRPDGRVVLQLDPAASGLPPMQIEDGDRLYIPARPTSVGVFGSVFNTGNFVFASTQRVGDYLQMAGGPTRGADKDSTFVIRANGSVVSNLQGVNWFSSGQLGTLEALPGDTIFVPEEMNKTTSIQSAKDWTQILYQLGLGLAGLRSATN